MLTRRQHRLLVFLHSSIRETGISPSFDEAMRAMGLKSRSGIHNLVVALEKKGYIRRVPHRARAIEVLRPPGIPGGPEPAGSPAILPLCGSQAQGGPGGDREKTPAELEIPAWLLVPGEVHYAIIVSGDIMRDAGIHDGDIAIMRRADSAGNGQIVAARIGKGPRTLQRFRKHGESVALEPANDAYEPHIFRRDTITIEGILTGIIRQYHGGRGSRAGGTPDGRDG